MEQVLQILAVLLVSIAMALALSHALEYPGKMRLDRDAYLTVQKIYYPRFTFAGFAEPVAILPMLALLFFTPRGSAAFWLTLGALIAIAGMHAIYWLMTAPVNKYWVANVTLDSASSAFFSAGAQIKGAESGAQTWIAFRDRWERSHMIRAALAFVSFLLLLIAITFHP